MKERERKDLFHDLRLGSESKFLVLKIEACTILDILYKALAFH